MLVGPWQIFARGIATTFIFVMGVSLTLSHARLSQQTERSDLFMKYFQRGAKIFGWGLLITVVTYFFIGRGFVIFGILHLLGFSTVAAYPFLRYRKGLNLLAGLGLIGLGLYLNTLVVSFPWLIWLGLKQAGRYMVDYYPVLPWFGISLLGVFAGYALYPHGTRHVRLPNLAEIPPVRGLRFLGQHSLLIYLVHQPILIGLFIALGYDSF